MDIRHKFRHKSFVKRAYFTSSVAFIFVALFAALGVHLLFNGKAITPSVPTIGVCGATKPSDVEEYTGPALPARTIAIQKTAVPAVSIGMQAFHILANKNQVYVMGDPAPSRIRSINIYNITNGALVTSFPVHVTGNSTDSFALDPSGNVYVNDVNAAIYAYSPTGTQIWTKTVHANWGGAYGYLDPNHNFRIGINALPLTRNFLSQSGQSLVFDSSGNPQPNNQITAISVVNQDSTTGDIMTVVSGVLRVYTSAGVLKLKIGTDLGANTPGPFHFYILSGAIEKPGGTGYYISDSGHGIESFDNSGSYLGLAPDFNAQNGAVNTVGGALSLGAELYNGTIYYGLNAGINAFDAANNKQGVYGMTLTDLNNSVNYPQGSNGHFGIGAGFSTSATDNYFDAATPPQVSLQFYSGWQAQASSYTGSYTVRTIEQIKAGLAGSNFSFSIPSSPAAYVNDVAAVPITLPPALTGQYEINAHLLKNGQPVGSDCLNYTVGEPGTAINPASPNLKSSADVAGIEQAHQFGQRLFRSNYNLTSCYDDKIYPPTMATAPVCPTAMISDTTAAGALAKQYGMDYEIQLGSAGKAKDLLDGGEAVFAHLVQQLVALNPGVNNWECWNEPDTNTFSGDTDYVNRALIGCHQGVKAANPSNIVIGGSFSSMTPTSGVWTQFLATGLPYVDEIGLHTYTGHNRSFEEQGYIIPANYSTNGEVGIIQQFQAEFASAGFHGKIRDTEQGFWVNGPYNSYTQGDRLIRKQILERSIGITDTANFLNHADYTIDGVLFTLIHAGSLTTGGAASGIYADKLYNRPFVAWLPTGTPHTYAAEFGPTTGNPGNIVVTWSDDINVNVVPSLSGGGSLSVTDEFGQVSSINSGSNLVLTGSVQYISVPSSSSLSLTPSQPFSPNLISSAKGTTAIASSSWNCGTFSLTPERAIDGISDIQGHGNICDTSTSTLWVGGNGDPSPTLTFTLPSAQTINRIYVSSQGLGSVEVGLRDYTISFDTGSGSFGNQINVSGQYFAHNNLINMPIPLSVKRIQISNMDINYSGYGDGLPPVFWTSTFSQSTPTIYEVEAYGPGTTTNPDTTPPSVVLTSPTANSSVQNSTAVTVNSTDNIGVSKVELYVDSALIATINSAPYNFSWNTNTYSNGIHNLSVKAYDASGNVASTTPINITVANVISSNLGDVNGDGHDTLTDLSILLSHYGSSGVHNQGDLDNNGVINLTDLSTLLSHFGT